MSDRNIWLGLGIFLILLGVMSAVGGVSLGSFSHVIGNGSGYTQGSYLVYNNYFILISLALVFSGAYTFYRAGKSISNTPKKHVEKVAPLSN